MTTTALQLFGKRYSDLNQDQLREYNRIKRQESRQSEPQREKEREYDRSRALKTKEMLQAFKLTLNANVQAGSNMLHNTQSSNIQTFKTVLPQLEEEGELPELTDEDEIEFDYIRPAKRPRYSDRTNSNTRPVEFEFEEDDSENVPPAKRPTPSSGSDTTNSNTPLRPAVLTDHCKGRCVHQIEEAINVGRDIGNNADNPNTYKMKGKDATVAVAKADKAAVTTWYNDKRNERFASPPGQPRFYRLPGEDESTMLSRIANEVLEHTTFGIRKAVFEKEFAENDLKKAVYEKELAENNLKKEQAANQQEVDWYQYKLEECQQELEQYHQYYNNNGYYYYEEEEYYDDGRRPRYG